MKKSKQSSAFHSFLNACSFSKLTKIIASLIWFFFVFNDFIFNIGDLITQYLPVFNGFIKFKFFIYVGIILISSFYMRNKKLRFALNCIYILIFPLVILFIHIPLLIYKYWVDVLILSPNLYFFIKHYKINIGRFLLFILSLIFIFNSSNLYLIYTSMAFIIINIFIHYFNKFYFIYFHSGIFKDVNVFIQSLDKDEEFTRLYSKPIPSKKRKKKMTSTSSSEADDEKKSNANHEPDKDNPWLGNIYSSYIVCSAFHYFSTKFKDISDSRKIEFVSLLSFFWSAFLTTISYGLVYFGLYICDKSNFDLSSYFSNKVGFIDFFLYSFNMLFNSSLSGILTDSRLVYFINNLEIFSSVIVVTLLISVFINSSTKKYKNDINILVNSLEEFEIKHKDMLFKTLNIDLKMAEDILIRHHEKSMRFFMKSYYSNPIYQKRIDDAKKSNNTYPMPTVILNPNDES